MRHVARWKFLSGIAVAILIATATDLRAEHSSLPERQPADCRTERPQPEAASRNKLAYVPPKRGVPYKRVGGGTREPNDNSRLFVLAPDHLGLSSHEQPVLYWFESTPTAHRTIFRLLKVKTNQVVANIPLTLRRPSGLQMVRLDEYKIKLATGVPYRWLVILESDSRGEFAFAGGAIERRAVSSDFTLKLRESCPSERPSIYLDAGIWYDALAALIELMNDAPQDMRLRTQYATLLEQAGLTDAQSLLQ